MNLLAFYMVIGGLGIPLYMSLVISIIIKAMFLFGERWTITPLLMILGSIATIYPAIKFFDHMISKMSALI